MTTPRKRQLDELNWDIEPKRDLWPEIAARIEQDSGAYIDGNNVKPIIVKQHTPAWMSIAMAACLMIAIGSVSLSYYSMQRNDEYLQVHATVLMQHQETIRAIEAQHQEVKTRLVALLNNPDGSLNPNLVAEANAILSTTSQASAQIKQAIHNAPDKQGYLNMLVKTYQRETELLNRIKLSQELSI